MSHNNKNTIRKTRDAGEAPPRVIYSIVIRDGTAGITCGTCDLTSYNMHDVMRLYCGHCHVFHNERIAAFGR